MNPKIKKLLQFAGKELLSFVLNQVFSIQGALGTILLSVAIFWHQLSIAAIKTWQLPPSQWTIQEISIAILYATIPLLSLILLWKYIIKKWFRPKTKGYWFESALGLAWKYNNWDNSVEGNPYCPKHKIKLRHEYTNERNKTKYTCHICKKYWSYYGHELQKAHEEVTSIAQAKSDGHFKES